ncbi:MAG: hypothetical protein NTV38_05440, partial [Chloroflexi bacterium]|nr:hypothetical protein [Chloroflexota bacterium]
MCTQFKSRFRIIPYGVVALGMFVLLGAGSLTAAYAQGALDATPPGDNVVPGTFAKTSPVNNTTFSAGSQVTLAWGTSTNATNYYFCFDQTNNDRCDGSWHWSGNTGFTINATGADLAPGSTNYWQVMACSSGDPKPSGCIEANNGVWWSFNMSVAFTKTSPVDNSTFSAGSPVTLAWGTSTNATNYYFCFDQTNNNRCDGSWYWSDNTDFTINKAGADLGSGSTN